MKKRPKVAPAARPYPMPRTWKPRLARRLLRLGTRFVATALPLAVRPTSAALNPGVLSPAGLPAGLVAELPAGLVAELAAGLVAELPAGLVAELAAGLVTELPAGLVAGLPAALTRTTAARQISAPAYTAAVAR